MDAAGDDRALVALDRGERAPPRNTTLENLDPAGDWISRLGRQCDLRPGEDFIDLDEPPADALAQVRLIWGNEDALGCFRTFSDQERDGFGRLYTGTLRAVWPDLAFAQLQGHGVFLVPNLGGQDAASIHTVTAVWMDGDGVELGVVLGGLTQLGLEPHLLSQRNDDPEHQWHLYILVDGLSPDEFTAVQQELIERFGTDAKIFDPSRVMRLAGTLHLKPVASS